MDMINSLPVLEVAKLHGLFMDVRPTTLGMEEYLTEHGFADGRVCPIYGDTHVRRNGRRMNGSRKFVCMDCKKNFSIRKNTIFSGTRKDLSVRVEYVKCMAEGLTLGQSAERCGITHYTSFMWRHKILEALVEEAKATELAGIVESDETFLHVSFKGELKAFVNGDACREPRRLGGENHTIELADELVCVPCTIDRKGNALSRITKLGKCLTKTAYGAHGGHVSHEATLCTDEGSSYRRFAKENAISLVQIKGGKRIVKGIYYIQHLNAYHSRLKEFLSQFKGVSSKYQNKYLIWNNELERKKGGLAEKAEAVLRQVVSAVFEDTCSVSPMRPAILLLIKNQS